MSQGQLAKSSKKIRKFNHRKYKIATLYYKKNYQNNFSNLSEKGEPDENLKNIFPKKFFMGYTLVIIKIRFENHAVI